MNIKLVVRVVATLVMVAGIAMLASVPVGWLMGDPRETLRPLYLTAAGVALFAMGVRYLARGKHGRFGFREGFGVVTFGWIFTTLAGALPYVFVSDFHYYDAIFETMSGFTTTGSSVIDSNLELMCGQKLPNGLADLPYGLLFWRGMTHWLGGMGIVVLSLAILPSLGISAHQLYKAEVPAGPVEEQLTPRIASSAKILWGVYVFLTVVETVLLYFGGMTLFDAWNHACSTLATGGFSTHQASIAFFDQPGYHSGYIDAVITIFMFFSGANFVLHFRALRGKPLTYFKDEEFIFYFFVTLIASVTITVFLHGSDIITTAGLEKDDLGWLAAFRYASFQVVALFTTTGFATADFNIWPAYAALLLMGLAFVGACSGSTSGGMKCSRVILLLKYAVSQVERRLFRGAMSNVHLNQQRIPSAVLHRTFSFFFLYVGIMVTITFALILLGANEPGELIVTTKEGAVSVPATGQLPDFKSPILATRSIASDDILTAATATLVSMSNTGPGLNKVGPMCSYSWLSPGSKLLLAFAMLLGRLELYTVLVVFLPAFWKK